MAHDIEHINGVEVRAEYLPVPRAIVNSERGSAIVLGRAPGWLDELDLALEATGHDAPVFAVNGQDKNNHYAGISGLVEHWVTTHGGAYPYAERWDGPIRHAVKPVESAPNADYRWPLVGTAGQGSSAFTATLIAIMMGFTDIVLAGVHLSRSRKTNAAGQTSFSGWDFFQGGWKARYEFLKGRVRSVSPEGTYLRDLFGGNKGE